MLKRRFIVPFIASLIFVLFFLAYPEQIFAANTCNFSTFTQDISSMRLNIFGDSASSNSYIDILTTSTFTVKNASGATVYSTVFIPFDCAQNSEVKNYCTINLGQVTGITNLQSLGIQSPGTYVFSFGNDLTSTSVSCTQNFTRTNPVLSIGTRGCIYSSQDKHLSSVAPYCGGTNNQQRCTQYVIASGGLLTVDGIPSSNIDNFPAGYCASLGFTGGMMLKNGVYYCIDNLAASIQNCGGDTGLVCVNDPTCITNPGGGNAPSGGGGVGVTAAMLEDFNKSIFGGKAPDAALTTPRGIISKLLPYLFTFGGLILFIMIVWGGFEMLTGAANPKSQEAGKQRITAAVIGFILLFISYWLAQILQLVFGISIL